MHENKTKNIALVVVTILIIGSIWYLESGKVSPANVPKGADISIDTASTTVQSTSTGTAVIAPNGATFVSVKAADIAAGFSPAHEIVPGGGFINTVPFALKDLIGKKVILLDFWTYSCINCQRVIPYLNAWYAKYKDEGLVIIGVHTPEFDFEKDLANVTNAVKGFGIQYPVVQDNDYGTWQTYGNQYWPHEYLIDIDGYIVHDKIGEGGYDETEKEIQGALQERAQVLGLNTQISTGITNPKDVIAFDPDKLGSPETYFGSARNEYLGNGTQGLDGPQTLSVPAHVSLNTLYLGGTWNFVSQYAENSSANAKIVFQYSAKNVYLVASADSDVKITVLQDGKVISNERGADVAADGTAVINANRLYNIVEGADYGQHTIEIDISNPGLKAYTFTFG